MKRRVYWYRYVDVAYSPGADQYGDPIHREAGSHIGLRLHKYEVISYTPKGVWLRDETNINGGPRSGQRFICMNWNKQFACPTEEEARESFIARKRRQIRIYESRARDAREALRLALLQDGPDYLETSFTQILA